jgi:hypothetical protein
VEAYSWSAIIGDAREGKEGINADHNGIAKFGGPEDAGFQKVSGVLAEYIEDIKKDRGIYGNYFTNSDPRTADATLFANGTARCPESGLEVIGDLLRHLQIPLPLLIHWWYRS